MEYKARCIAFVSHLDLCTVSFTFYIHPVTKMLRETFPVILYA